MKYKFVFAAILIVGIILILTRVKDYTVVYDTVGDGGSHKIHVAYQKPHNQYAFWDSKIQNWRWIMLPNTEIGFTAYTIDGKIIEQTETKVGHATTLSEVDEKYMNNTIIKQVLLVSDGNYLVYRQRPGEPNWNTWTVWTKELWEAVKQKQGL